MWEVITYKAGAQKATATSPSELLLSMKEKEIKQKIGDWFDEYLTILKLGGYALFVMSPSDEEWKDSEKDGFSVELEYPYKNIKLYIPKNYIEDFDIKTKQVNIKNSLLHEALHILLWKYSRLAESRFITKEQFFDEEEEVTDHLSSVIQSLYKDN